MTDYLVVKKKHEAKKERKRKKRQMGAAKILENGIRKQETKKEQNQGGIFCLLSSARHLISKVIKSEKLLTTFSEKFLCR